MQSRKVNQPGARAIKCCSPLGVTRWNCNPAPCAKIFYYYRFWMSEKVDSRAKLWRAVRSPISRFGFNTRRESKEMGLLMRLCHLNDDLTCVRGAVGKLRGISRPTSWVENTYYKYVR